MDASYRQRVALISGGSSGIGLAFVGALHAQGYQVVFCGRNADRLRDVEKAYPGSLGKVCDVADKEAVLRFAKEVLAAHPAIDLLISNAGGMIEVDFTRDDIASIDITAELRSNLEGAIHLVAAFLPGLRAAAPASIVIVSSGYALAPATRAPIYSAAKAALRSFSKALRRQLAPLKIAVTEVAPPLVDTPAVAYRDAPKISPQAVVAQTLSAVRRGKPEVYPGLVRWLPLLLRISPTLAERIVDKN